jgi:hypothetical protein
MAKSVPVRKDTPPGAVYPEHAQGSTEKERTEKERTEKERTEKERTEKERTEKERTEKERTEKERTEKERRSERATHRARATREHAIARLSIYANLAPGSPGRARRAAVAAG